MTTSEFVKTPTFALIFERLLNKIHLNMKSKLDELEKLNNNPHWTINSFTIQNTTNETGFHDIVIRDEIRLDIKTYKEILFNIVHKSIDELYVELSYEDDELFFNLLKDIFISEGNQHPHLPDYYIMVCSPLFKKIMFDEFKLITKLHEDN